jgi:plastocyanin
MTMRIDSWRHAPAFVAVSIVLASLGIVACMSDRATSTAVSTGTCSTPTSAAGATIVFIRDFAFVTPTVRVKAGTSVAWVNCEPTNIPHTSTADGGAWDSGSLAPAAAFTRTFATAGTFPYHCAIHTGMKATVIVE